MTNKDDKKKKEHQPKPMTIPNACPRCDGGVFDGTATGWFICDDCGYIPEEFRPIEQSKPDNNENS